MKRSVIVAIAVISIILSVESVYGSSKYGVQRVEVGMVGRRGEAQFDMSKIPQLGQSGTPVPQRPQAPYVRVSQEPVVAPRPSEIVLNKLTTGKKLIVGEDVPHLGTPESRSLARRVLVGQNGSQKTLLLQAMRENNIDAAKYFIRSGADINFVNPKTNETILSAAALSKNPAAFEMLLKNGADFSRLSPEASQKIFDSLFLYRSSGDFVNRHSEHAILKMLVDHGFKFDTSTISSKDFIKTIYSVYFMSDPVLAKKIIANANSELIMSVIKQGLSMRVSQEGISKKYRSKSDGDPFIDLLRSSGALDRLGKIDKKGLATFLKATAKSDPAGLALLLGSRPAVVKLRRFFGMF